MKGNIALYNNEGESNAVPLDELGNFLEYSEVTDSLNNDWNMSKVFPDPYSCMSCHPNS